MKAAKTRRPAPPRPSSAAIAPARGVSMGPWPFGAAVLFALVFAVYGPGLNGPFMLDDTYLPYTIAGESDKPLSVWMQGVRPLLMFSFWLNYQVSGNSTFGYHAANVLLHFLNGTLLFLICRRLLEWVRTPKPALDWLALFGAGLFLFHPLQTESVTYIASRSETLSVFLFLCAFAVFLYRRREFVTWPVAAGVLVLYGAACLVKEHAVVLPGLLVLTDFWFGGWERVRRNWRIYVPLLVLAAAGLALVARVLATSTSAGFGLKDLPWYQYFFTQCRAIWVYVLLFLFPFGQNVDHDFNISRTLLDHGAVFGLIALLAAIGAAWFYRKRFPLATWGALAFFVLIAPTSSVVPIQDVLVERRLYLPFIGLILILIEVFRRWKTTRTTLAGALLVLLALEAVLAYQRNTLWSSAVALWSDSVAKSPRKVRPRFQLAFAYYAAGRCGDAVREYDTAEKAEKPDYKLLLDSALASDCAGDENAALKKLLRAAEIEKSGHVYASIGMVYAKQGRDQEALQALNTAVSLDPAFDMGWVYRGNVYFKLNNFKDAAADYERALQLNPLNETARQYKALAQARLSGRS